MSQVRGGVGEARWGKGIGADIQRPVYNTQSLYPLTNRRRGPLPLAVFPEPLLGNAVFTSHYRPTCAAI